MANPQSQIDKHVLAYFIADNVGYHFPRVGERVSL